MMATGEKRTQRAVVGVLLAGLAAATLLPFAMTLIMSQKTNGEILNHF